MRLVEIISPYLIMLLLDLSHFQLKPQTSEGSPTRTYYHDDPHKKVRIEVTGLDHEEKFIVTQYVEIHQELTINIEIYTIKDTEFIGKYIISNGSSRREIGGKFRYQLNQTQLSIEILASEDYEVVRTYDLSTEGFKGKLNQVSWYAEGELNVEFKEHISRYRYKGTFADDNFLGGQLSIYNPSPFSILTCATLKRRLYRNEEGNFVYEGTIKENDPPYKRSFFGKFSINESSFTLHPLEGDMISTAISGEKIFQRGQFNSTRTLVQGLRLKPFHITPCISVFGFLGEPTDVEYQVCPKSKHLLSIKLKNGLHITRQLNLENPLVISNTPNTPLTKALFEKIESFLIDTKTASIPVDYMLALHQALLAQEALAYTTNIMTPAVAWLNLKRKKAVTQVYKQMSSTIKQLAQMYTLEKEKLFNTDIIQIEEQTKRNTLMLKSKKAYSTLAKAQQKEKNSIWVNSFFNASKLLKTELSHAAEHLQTIEQTTWNELLIQAHKEKTSIELKAFFDNILLQLSSRGFEAYIVGSAVVSWHLKQPLAMHQDIDIVVSLKPEQIFDFEQFRSSTHISGLYIGSFPYDKNIIVSADVMCVKSTLSDTEFIMSDAQTRDTPMGCLYYQQGGILHDPSGKGVWCVENHIVELITENPIQYLIQNPLVILRLIKLVVKGNQLVDKIEETLATIEFKDPLPKPRLITYLNHTRGSLSQEEWEKYIGHLNKYGLTEKLFKQTFQDINGLNRYLATHQFSYENPCKLSLRPTNFNCSPR